MQHENVYLCLTWRGTILTRDEQGMPFLHESLGKGIPANAARFALHCSAAGSKLGVTARLLPGSPAIIAAETTSPPEFVVIPAGTGRAAYLHLGKNFAVTPKEGVLLQGRSEPNSFAVFVFVPEQELQDLLFIRNNQWQTGAGNLIRHGESGFRTGFKFSFGETAADLRFGPGFAASPASQTRLTEVTIMRDGWKIAGQLSLFRPLIYYTAFGRREIFEQLRWSLRSLAAYGGYAGDVHVISDRPRDYIAQFVPEALQARLTVQHICGMDFWDFAFARLRLDQWPPAASFQPILYVDTDIAFDRPVEPLLKNIALSGKICVVSESFSRLNGPDWAGAPLFRMAGVETAEDIGFNSGCQGFPNLAAAARYFSLTLHAAESFRAFHPGGVNVYGDQPFANYVAYMTETLNTEVMDAAMRLSSPELSAAPADRTGMVHFWPCRRVTSRARVQEVKRDHMQAYVEALAEAAPARIEFEAAAD
jgi:hypothetical protein